ncbi:hypothetical protein EVAR_22127_1 [Eumeta japonica]|uniref:Uncharacterized protein n=1 Tax=Eumeta variegata TaxID=151549 RepID=A0A4C1VZK9_EUMVA|nr:hypothetical protein EVAR_22127_1 [Eumeta japonica]
MRPRPTGTLLQIEPKALRKSNETLTFIDRNGTLQWRTVSRGHTAISFTFGVADETGRKPTDKTSRAREMFRQRGTDNTAAVGGTSHEINATKKKATVPVSLARFIRSFHRERDAVNNWRIASGSMADIIACAFTANGLHMDTASVSNDDPGAKFESPSAALQLHKIARRSRPAIITALRENCFRAQTRNYRPRRGRWRTEHFTSKAVASPRDLKSRPVSYKDKRRSDRNDNKDYHACHCDETGARPSPAHGCACSVIEHRPGDADAAAAATSDAIKRSDSIYWKIKEEIADITKEECAHVEIKGVQKAKPPAPAGWTTVVTLR